LLSLYYVRASITAHRRKTLGEPRLASLPQLKSWSMRLETIRLFARL
jgi:hypothetical protein